MTVLDSAAHAVIGGYHADPFAFLGMHIENDRTVVRAYMPGASRVAVLDEGGGETELPRIHDAGLFAGPVPTSSRNYRLRTTFGDSTVDLQDAYRFPPVLSDFD